jgi:hypothetical protein
VLSLINTPPYAFILWRFTVKLSTLWFLRIRSHTAAMEW